MKKAIEFIKQYAVQLLVACSFLLYVRACNLSSELQSSRELLQQQEQQFQTLRKRDSLQSELNALKINKRLLQDMNHVVFTNERPDSALIHYERLIEAKEQALDTH